MKTAAADNADENDIPSTIERAYNAGLKWVGAELWRGVLTIAASGFGKGALMIAGTTLLACGLAVALFATGGTFLGGMAVGAQLLGTSPGLAIVGAGGLLGAFSELRINQSGAAQAERLAAHYAKQRAHKTPQKSHAPASSITDGQNEKGFREEEKKRRAEAPQRVYR